MAGMNSLLFASITGPSVATATGMTALGGFAIGAAAAGYAEVKLRDFEASCQTPRKYKVRWLTAQGVRFALFGAGTTLTVTACLGLICATSILATVAIASCGIGVAVVAGVCFAAAIVRYNQIKDVMEEKEAREDAQTELVENLDHLSDQEIQSAVHAGIFRSQDLGDMLRNEDNTSAARKFLRLRAFV
jgi:hypothetical protein